MSMDKKLLRRLSEEHDSFYAYDLEGMRDNAAALSAAFGPELGLLYSVKANPHPLILGMLHQCGFGLDAASMGEVVRGHKAGFEPERIFYSAPGKSMSDIEKALGGSVIIADSLSELHRISEIAARKGRRAEVGVRINPNFGFAHTGCAAAKFGIDEDALFESLDEIRALEGLKIRGIHVHSKSQELRTEVIAEYHRNVAELALRFSDALGKELGFINFGSGIGIPYAPTDTRPDIVRLGENMRSIIAQSRTELPGTRFYMETGRFICGKHGVYVTKVMDKKGSCGKVFVILANTLNGFVRPSLARMVEGAARDEVPAAVEPLYTGLNTFTVTPLTDETETEKVTLVGNLCTAADVILSDAELPRLKVGDAVMINNAGAYAAVLSPMQFATLTPPEELVVLADGSVK